MGSILEQLITKPILNFLIFLYNYLPGHDLGLVIIVVTIIVRLIVLPLSLKSSRAQRKLKNLTPQLNELKEKHKGDQQALAKAQMEFYKQNGVSPFGSCLPVLIQLPILIGLYSGLRYMITTIEPHLVYSFNHQPETIDTFFLGFLDLAKKCSELPIYLKYGLPLTSGIFQYILGVMTMPVDNSKNAGPESAMNKQMVYMFPVLTVFLAWSVPSGLVLYWVSTTLFSIGQQIWVNKEKRNEVTIKIKKYGDHEEIVVEELAQIEEKKDGAKPTE